MRRITTIISETYVSFRLIQSLQFNSHFILSLSVMCHLSSVSQISIFFIFQHFLPSILWLFVFRSSFFSFSLLLVYFSSPCRLSVGTFSISIEVASSCYLIVPRHLLFIRHQRMCVCFKKKEIRQLLLQLPFALTINVFTQAVPFVVAHKHGHCILHGSRRWAAT